MKTTKIAFLAILASVLVSCSDAKLDPPVKITGLTEDVYFEQVGQIDSIGLTEHYELLIQQTTEKNADDTAFLAYLQEQLAIAEEYQEECINAAGANFDVGADGAGGKNRLLGYQYATIRYKSIDHHNNPVVLSTLVVWPYNNVFSNPDPNNVIIGCHVTIGSNAERPTNYSKNSIMSDVGMLACCAKSNGVGSEYENLVIIPDYQGYGATHGEPHPYLSQELTARQVLDGVKAGIQYFQQRSSSPLEKDWRSVSTGYSQGGSVAMAVHKYIEQNDLVSEFRFAGSVCGSGPYDPIATLQKYIKTDEVYMPVAVGMMLYSMCKTSPRLLGKFDADDYLTKKFLDSGIIQMIEAKNKNTDQMQEELLAYSLKFNKDDETTLCMWHLADDDKFYPYRKDTKEDHDWASGLIRTAYAKTSDILRPELISFFKDNVIPENKEQKEAQTALKEALNDNVLHNGWQPARPCLMYHTEADEVVTIDNYYACLKAWEGNTYVKGIKYRGTTETHVSYGSYFYMCQDGYGIDDLLDDDLGDYEFDGVDNGIL